MNNRTEKTFWYADLDNLEVVETVGYSTQTPDEWWFPGQGYSLTVGKKVFNSSAEAQKAIALGASDALKSFVIRIQKILEFLSSNTNIEKSADCCWCKSGSFVFDGGVLESLPPQYEFKCNNCGAKASLKPSDIRDHQNQ